jgi:catechol 2,3-dioxygenase-like lactoylglutathione lyase family enzyme
MNLGNFSLSLSVKNLDASRAFYSKLGFQPGAGDGTSWLVMQNGTTTIGLFQGMFERNMLTFNPGWDAQKAKLDTFTDVRDLQPTVKRAGIEPTKAADESTTGPEHFMLVDPDGNPILIDQHV